MNVSEYDLVVIGVARRGRSALSQPQRPASALPYGICTIPEISMVGQTEETLTSHRIPYEVGIAEYSELAKTMMLGDEAGILKLLFDQCIYIREANHGHRSRI